MHNQVFSFRKPDQSQWTVLPASWERSIVEAGGFCHIDAKCWAFYDSAPLLKPRLKFSIYGRVKVWRKLQQSHQLIRFKCRLTFSESLEFVVNLLLQSFECCHIIMTHIVKLISASTSSRTPLMSIWSPKISTLKPICIPEYAALGWPFLDTCMHFCDITRWAMRNSILLASSECLLMLSVKQHVFCRWVRHGGLAITVAGICIISLKMSDTMLVANLMDKVILYLWLRRVASEIP